MSVTPLDVRIALELWAADLIEQSGVENLYLLGSLIYDNGNQFDPTNSDIDLVIVMPELKGVTERYRWMESLGDPIKSLELSMLQLLKRVDAGETITSITPITAKEVQADVHKDGHRGFYKENRFYDLLNRKFVDGIPQAGTQTLDRFGYGALGFVQKIRNEFLSVSVNGTTALREFEGVDPLPKRFMRAAALAMRINNPELPPGAEYDLNEGLDSIGLYLRQNRDVAPALKEIQNNLMVRRGRGNRKPLSSGDQLLVAEVIYQLLADRQSLTGEPLKNEQVADEHQRQPKQERPALKETGPTPRKIEPKEDSRLPSTAFFYERFRAAFPGITQLSWFYDRDEISQRLMRLLAPPIKFKNGAPIWWWRGGNLQIERFVDQRDGTFLMNYEELLVERIAAVPAQNYKYCFVYVQTEPMKPTGLYDPPDAARLARRLETFGYDSEEYGLVEDGMLVTRAEYDDGAAYRDGKLIDISSRSTLRVRYTTPYNFLIAANGSPINNPHFDSDLESLLNQAALGHSENVLPTLTEKVLGLPSRREH
ncbi:hypothetical protein [Bradyrhizobium sp. CCBAU 25338]|uniref:hypothetical protein n=1 Tax=Bradyrhizobium sp. CCBAU 25338 TaxID=1641877 RepID=UPI0023044B62|nr:hypothetical protein [Bradyrhizobium sp. CCBAU 25338]